MITIIVPCKNRIDQLGECLDSILISIEEAKKLILDLEEEIIVVNDHSEEGFSTKVKEMYPNVIVLDSIGLGPGVARNYGIEKSKGKYIFFTDSDCIVDKNWIINGYNTFIKKSPIVIQGIPWLFQKNRNEVLGQNEEKLYEIMFSTYLDGEFSSMTDSRNLLFDREIVNILGKEIFAEKQDKATAESRVFGKKCISKGINIYFDKNVKVYHEDSSNMLSVCKQKYRHGTGRVMIWDEKPKYEHLKFRYYDNPINNGVDKDYILPAHTAFLLGYYKHINNEVEFKNFMKFVRDVFEQYGRKIEDYNEILELMKDE